MIKKISSSQVRQKNTYFKGIILAFLKNTNLISVVLAFLKKEDLKSSFNNLYKVIYCQWLFLYNYQQP